jgi:nicotinamide-nucleotide amidase
MARRLLSAQILAVGSELTTGATRDSNAGDLARELTGLGVTVERLTALPDDLEVVSGAFAAALASADLVVSTGGLGPTPDDLTREAIAAACGVEPAVDHDLEAWLQALFARRGVPMPESNIKQAWLIPGASSLPNELGSAPGWWVDRPDGRVIVALPGPPREMWPMWRASVVARLRQQDVGVQRASRTLRLTGVGESALVGLIGEELLRSDNPQVATYARPDAVDVRISATTLPGGAPAAELVESVVARLRPQLEQYVFAEGEQGWPEVLRARLGERMLATIEIGTGGQLMALLGAAPFLRFGELLGSAAALQHSEQNLDHYAERVREMSGADVGLAVRATERGGDTRVQIAISTADTMQVTERTAFLAGGEGRRRAAIAACAELWRWLPPPHARAH